MAQQRQRIPDSDLTPIQKLGRLHQQRKSRMGQEDRFWDDVFETMMLMEDRVKRIESLLTRQGVKP